MLDLAREISGRSEKATPTVSSVNTCASETTPGLEWCKPFLCKGTVTIGDKNYPVTVLKDTAAQQSLCRNVTGDELQGVRDVLCRGINAINRFITTTLRLRCPLVDAEARVAVMDELPVPGVDFLLGNDLAGIVYGVKLLWARTAQKQTRMGRVLIP